MADAASSPSLAKQGRTDTKVRSCGRTDVAATRAAGPQISSALQEHGEASPAPTAAVTPSSPKPWQLPPQGLAVFHGSGEAARLSHYFLPRLLLQGKRVLMLDGANCADPRLIARFARERGVPFEQFSRQIEIARAFTCFQLTELIARVPRLLEDFPAEVLIVTAFPELYYDEDVRDWDARVAFEQALANLRRWATQPHAVAAVSDRWAALGTPPLQAFVGVQTSGAYCRPPLSVAIFSALPTFTPAQARRRFFPATCAAATEVWEFGLGEDGRLKLSAETAARTPHPQPLSPRERGQFVVNTLSLGERAARSAR